jgi:predicted RNA-binding protein associated with RNAse of E/G family
MTALTVIVEIKETLAGVRHTFACRAIARAAGEVVVLFVLPAERVVDGLVLPAGTVTFGHFWQHRPYNVYHWMTPAGATIAFYVNLADRTTIDETRLAFRDLSVDILLPPQGPPRVLDEDEVPVTLDAATRASITAAQAMVLQDAEALREEIDRRSRVLWPQVFGGQRP